MYLVHGLQPFYSISYKTKLFSIFYFLKLESEHHFSVGSTYIKMKPFNYNHFYPRESFFFLVMWHACLLIHNTRSSSLNFNIPVCFPACRFSAALGSPVLMPSCLHLWSCNIDQNGYPRHLDISLPATTEKRFFALIDKVRTNGINMYEYCTLLLAFHNFLLAYHVT